MQSDLDTDTQTYDVSALTNGVYLVKVESEYKTMCRKLIITR